MYLQASDPRPLHAANAHFSATFEGQHRFTLRGKLPEVRRGGGARLR